MPSPAHIVDEQAMIVAALLNSHGRRVALLPTAVTAELHSLLDNMIRAIHMAAEWPSLLPRATDLALQAYPPSERRGESGRWLPVLAHLADLHQGQNTPPALQLLNRLGQVQRLQQQLPQAVAVHQRALALAHHLEDTLLLAQSHWQLAEDYRFQWQTEPALTHAEQAWALLAESQGEAIRWQGAVANTLAVLAQGQGDYEAAVAYFEQALDIHMALELPVEVGRNWLNLGRVAVMQKEFAHAHTCYEQALTYAKNNLAEQFRILNNLGALYAAEEKFDQALQTFYKAEKLLYLGSIDILHQAQIAHNIGYCLSCLGRWPEAIPIVQQAILHWEIIGYKPDWSGALSILAKAFANNNQRLEALTAYDQALALVQEMPDQQKWYQTLQTRQHALLENES